MFDERGERVFHKEFSFESRSTVTGLLYYDPWIYIVHQDGTITKIREDLERRTASTFDIQTDGVYPGYVIKEDILLLADSNQGTVFKKVECYLMFQLFINSVTASWNFDGCSSHKIVCI